MRMHSNLILAYALSSAPRLRGSCSRPTSSFCSSGFVHPHPYKYLLEVAESKAHTCLNCAKRNLRSLSDFRMGPSLKISQLDHQTLFCGNLHERCSNMCALHRS